MDATVIITTDGGDGTNIPQDMTSNHDFNTVTKWSSRDVAKWLRTKGHDEEYIALLCENQRIDGKSLLLLTETDLKQPPIQIKVKLNGHHY